MCRELLKSLNYMYLFSPSEDATARRQTLSTPYSRGSERYPGISKAIGCSSLEPSTRLPQQVLLKCGHRKEILRLSRKTTTTNTEPLCYKSSFSGTRFIDITHHSDCITTLVPPSSTTSRMDPHNLAQIAQYQPDYPKADVVVAKRRAQPDGLDRRLTEPRILSAATGNAPIRPPLPSPEDIRSRIPPQGISPRAVSASFGNMIVGRGIFKDDSRRQQFWNLVAQNAQYDRHTKRLSPLYRGAYQGPPSRPPLPSANDIRARISSGGIYAENLFASYGECIMGTGKYNDTKRLEQIHSLIHTNAVLLRDTMTFKLAPRLPTAAELRSLIPPQGLTMDDFINHYHTLWWTQERMQILQQLLTENLEFSLETRIFFVKRRGSTGFLR